MLTRCSNAREVTYFLVVLEFEIELFVVVDGALEGEAVLDVFTGCTPAQVLKTVVSCIAVDMVYLGLIVTAREVECGRNEPTEAPLFALALIIYDGDAFVVADDVGLDEAMGLAYTHKAIAVNLVIAIARDRVPL